MSARCTVKVATISANTTDSTSSALTLPADAKARILQGQAAQMDEPAGTTGLVRLYDQDRCFLGLGELQEGGRLLPKRLLAAPQPAARGTRGDSQEFPKIA